MRVHLGLGSNLGDRRAMLAGALAALDTAELRLRRVSPVFETPALLPANAPSDWNLPFLNLAAEFDTALAPAVLLERISVVEQQLGRQRSARWAPRPIDIDILLYGRERINTAELTIPHPGITERPFVLAPLIALDPSLTIPDTGSRTLLEWSETLDETIPVWMSIVNLTPDSFSDGGRLDSHDALTRHVDSAVTAGAGIIDLGAESTRPGATVLSAEQEWARLAPALRWILDRYRDDPLRPRISIDTYHPEVAARALALGVDMINDVSGLTRPPMIELAAGSTADFVAMHHVTIPVDRTRTLPADADPCAEVERWLFDRLEHWQRAGVDSRRIVFDPGIGFGKTALQSLTLLRHIGRFRRHGLRVLVGHSRKSFMHAFSGPTTADRDLTTLGASLRLCTARVDILRVHDVALHTATYRGWAHLAQ